MRIEKIAILDEVVARVKDSDYCFILDHGGGTVAKIAKLRADLRKCDSRLLVVKNTFLAKAAKDMLVLPENRMAILFDESAFASFKRQVRAAKTIETVYIVTDYAPAYRSMARAFPGMKTYSLYRNYLDSFRINVSRN